MSPSPRLGYLLCVLTAFIWASTSPGMGYLLDVYGSHALTVAFWRDAFIALALLAVIGGAALARRRPLPRISAAELRGFALAGAISVGIYHALFVSSIAINGAALAIVLIYTYPAFVTLGAWLIFHERIGLQQVLALALALAGCVLLVRAYDPAVLRSSWLGVLVGLASAITHAGYVLFNQRAVSRHSPWVSLALTMSFGSLALLVIGLAMVGPAGLLRLSPAPTPSPWPWLILLGIALGPTLFGYALFTISLRHIPGRIASLIVVIEAPVATAAAVLLLGERVTPPQLVGMGLILAAAVLPGLRLRLPGRRPVAAVGP